jgi:hypothetical protein
VLIIKGKIMKKRYVIIGISFLVLFSFINISLNRKLHNSNNILSDQVRLISAQKILIDKQDELIEIMEENEILRDNIIFLLSN